MKSRRRGIASTPIRCWRSRGRVIPSRQRRSQHSGLVATSTRRGRAAGRSAGSRAGGKRKEIIQAYVDDATGTVTPSGPASRWRGRWRAAIPGAFGRVVNSWWCGCRCRCLPRAVPPLAAKRRACCIARPADVPGLLGLVGLLQPRDPRAVGAAHLPVAAVPAGADAAAGVRQGPPARAAPVVVPCPGWSSRSIFLVGFRDRAQRHQLERDRRRLRRRDRRRQADPRPAALRPLAVRQPLRRHLRPGQLLRLHPFRPIFGWSGQWDNLPPRTPPRSPSTC